VRHCLNCDFVYENDIKVCPGCGSGPREVEGFDAFAPDLAYQSSGFREEFFAELSELEETNFWFRARNKILLWALGRYAPDFPSLLEIGCGTGYVLSGVSQSFPHAALFGSEIFVEGLHFAAKRLPSIKLMQMDGQAIPFRDEFGVVGAFDVLEHIADDERVLAQIYKALKPGGTMLITVPQHTWLWSASDEYACHIRRYPAKEIEGKVEAAGFRVIRSTSFVTALLPAMIVSRLLSKRRRGSFDPTSEFRISPVLNALFTWILECELSIIKIGANFPVGGSRLIIARK